MGGLTELITRLQVFISGFQLVDHITDLIDIAIMAVLIYKLIDLVQTTSSGRVMKGILLVLLVLGISSVFNLYTVNFLLSKVLEMGVVAIVVLFQPELRKILEQVGNSSLSQVLSGNRQGDIDQLDNAITQTVDAYTTFSKNKTGALMVFERRNHLDEAIRTGTALDTVVNAELLRNIFWNKAPLHDGAVIVRDGRIVGAGCMLPMSGNVNLSRDLGMRHRAGIGASEQTDAVVAIVSEETGSISVAVGGMLKRHLTPETLERLLRNELLPEKKEEETASFVTRISGLLRGKREERKDGAE